VALGLLAFPGAGRVAAQAMPFDSSIIQTMGAEAPPNGTAFTDVIGRNNRFGTPSFTVLDFNSGDLGLGTVTTVNSLTLAMEQDLFGASSKGRMDFFVTDDTTTDIDFPTSPLMFDMTDPKGLGSQLSNLYLLGHHNFRPVRSGHLDTFTFNITDPALNAYLVNQINTGGVIRIVLAPDATNAGDEEAGGSYGGYANTRMELVPVLSASAQ
jgi:hypothetical protein